MINNNPNETYSLFPDFEPVGWTPDGNADGEGNTVYSLRRDHGVTGIYRLHNPNDEINDSRAEFDKIILEYRIHHNSYPLYTVGDLLRSSYAFGAKSEGTLVGDIAERIARRITKYWLKHYSPHGKTGGIFDKRFNPLARDGFVIAHSPGYVLKIQKYPNCVILKKTGRGKFGYESVKELDGLFDYRYFLRRHILVLESKVERTVISPADVARNLFSPLRELFPKTDFSYILFTDRNSIYQKKHFARRRQIKQFPYKIYSSLREVGIGVLFFSFNETRDDLERMKNHLITQYRALHKMGVALSGKTVLTGKEIIVFDEGETPHLKLVKDAATGMWKEVKLTHKKRK